MHTNPIGLMRNIEKPIIMSDYWLQNDLVNYSGSGISMTADMRSNTQKFSHDREL